MSMDEKKARKKAQELPVTAAGGLDVAAEAEGAGEGFDAALEAMSEMGKKRAQEIRRLGIKADAIEEMEVMPGHPANKNVIWCRRASGERVTVWVGNNKNYLPRLFNGEAMRVVARMERGRWFASHPEPRSPGRW